MRKGGIEASHLCMVGYKEMRKYIEKISKLERNLKNPSMVHTNFGKNKITTHHLDNAMLKTKLT